MKKAIISLCSVILIFLSITFAGCTSVQLYEVEWHFVSYEIIGDNYIHYVGFDNFDHFGSTVSECAQISFKEDGSFSFTDMDGVEYSGTYKSKKNEYDTDVTLTFADGSEAAGWYAKYDFADYTYEAQFEIFGVKYCFGDTELKFYEENLEKCLSTLADAICTFATDGKMGVQHYPYYENLKKAVIGKVGDKVIAVTENKSYLLSDAKFWCYNVDGEGIESCELKEGECVIRIGYDCFAIYYPQIS